MFCELVGLTSSTVEETMTVVSIMNNVFSLFDTLMDQHGVYKVRYFEFFMNETITKTGQF